MDTKELVKRLRMATTILPPANVCINAADEIERLRTEVQELQEAYEYLRPRVPLFVREEDL